MFLTGLPEAAHVALDDQGDALGGEGAEEPVVAVGPPEHRAGD